MVDVVTQYDLHGLKSVFVPCCVAGEDMLQNSIPFSPVKLRMDLKQIATEFFPLILSTCIWSREPLSKKIKFL